MSAASLEPQCISKHTQKQSSGQCINPLISALIALDAQLSGQQGLRQYTNITLATSYAQYLGNIQTTRSPAEQWPVRQRLIALIIALDT
jgi:hypothetical protein